MDTSDPITFDATQVLFLRTEGYINLEGFVSLEDVERIRQIYDALFAGRYQLQEKDIFDLATVAKGSQGKKLLPQLMDPSKYEPELHQTDYFRRAQAVSRQVLGPGAKFDFDHFIDKPLQVAHETPWHQDMGYWRLQPDAEPQALNFWLALDTADVDNGCMQFIPRSHRGPLRPHRHINDDPNVHGLVCDDVDLSQAVACPLSPGGVTIHWPKMLHYTGPNKTDRPRRAYIMVFHVKH